MDISFISYYSGIEPTIFYLQKWTLSFTEPSFCLRYITCLIKHGNKISNQILYIMLATDDLTSTSKTRQDKEDMISSHECPINQLYNMNPVCLCLFCFWHWFTINYISLENDIIVLRQMNLYMFSLSCRIGNFRFPYVLLKLYIEMQYDF